MKNINKTLTKVRVMFFAEINKMWLKGNFGEFRHLYFMSGPRKPFLLMSISVFYHTNLMF